MASNYVLLISAVMMCFDLKLQSDDLEPVFVLNASIISNPACNPFVHFRSGPLSPGRGEGWSQTDGTAQHQLAFPARQSRTVRPEAAGHAARQAVCVLLCQLWVCLHSLANSSRKYVKQRQIKPGLICWFLGVWITWC